MSVFRDLARDGRDREARGRYWRAVLAVTWALSVFFDLRNTNLEDSRALQ